MKVALVPNMSKKSAIFYTRKIIKLLLKFNINVIISETTKIHFENFGCAFLPDDDLYSSCDVVVTVGGDGTLIHAAIYAAMYEKPILGVNLGRLGFVTEVEKTELHKLSRLATFDYSVESRMLLKIALKNSGTTKTYHALNDAVISSALVSNLIDINMSLNGAELCSIRADGIIVATPTGSTAYSLSAGGPIIDPCMNCILTTPICSHSLFSRPMVFSEKSVLALSFSANKNLFLTIDGRSTLLNDGATVEISASEKNLKLISFKDTSFYQKITSKLSERKF